MSECCAVVAAVALTVGWRNMIQEIGLYASILSLLSLLSLAITGCLARYLAMLASNVVRMCADISDSAASASCITSRAGLPCGG